MEVRLSGRLAQCWLEPIQLSAAPLWSAERERQAEEKVVKLARRLKRERNDKDHHLLLVRLVSGPDCRGLQRSDPTTNFLLDFPLREEADLEKQPQK